MATQRSTTAIVLALGTAQTVAWASSYYLPAVLATPMARDLSTSPVEIFAAFSAALVVSAVVGPWAGAMIDRQGGRGVLIGSNLIFAAGLACLAMAQGKTLLWAGWLAMGLGMGIGLYEAAFAALAGIYGREARSPITGITLLAGFASTIGWPLSALMEAEIGWRGACLGWAGLHLMLALPLNWLLPSGKLAVPSHATAAKAGQDIAGAEPKSRWIMALLALVFAISWFNSTAMAAHLPRLLEAAGATTAVAVAAGALIGPAQVAARLAEFTLMRRLHPLISARLATLTHPLGAGLLLVLGAPGAYGFAFLHGAGNGVLTIAKGTLPLALFGPVGYGLTQGLIGGPGRALQAAAPLLFGLALDRWGVQAIWLTSGLGVIAFLMLLLIRLPKGEMRN
ncbi:membrane protein [Bosea sp. WAO]|uniref:MFS transporter n=1 Tax=Bosea sp. WAO TaxID=406341 RepID=UPI000748948E|nr:MFS transporter [Bosea sp. WAO]KUL93556.1 membrane protein [Bosea sp. WAO]